jgi:hypothetical protein
MDNKTFTIGSTEYEVPPEVAIKLSAYLAKVYFDLGKPIDLFTDSGRKLMHVIIASWQDLYPRESAEWLAMREDYKKSELSIHEQVKQRTGRSLASVPGYIFMMIKGFYRNKLDRKFYKNLVKEFPMFQMCNKY